MSDMTSTKPYSIAKRTVWEAYQQVKSNRGAAGIDDETIEMYEQNLSKNLYKLGNRMSSGSGRPPPVKQVEILKAMDDFRKQGERGTPKGGVVSPILMNLFMHYTFDQWMKRTYPQCPFARYADDAVVHCRSQKQAEDVMQTIALRLEECGLTMHPEKSKIVYCKDSNRTKAYSIVQFTFLGFTFRPRKARNKHGCYFTNFLPAVSKIALKRMRQKVRSWRLLRRTPATLAELAQQYNPTIRGWMNYFEAFYRTAMQELYEYLDQKLMRWARRKYKTLKQHQQRSVDWFYKMRTESPKLFVYWRGMERSVG